MECLFDNSAGNKLTKVLNVFCSTSEHNYKITKLSNKMVPQTKSSGCVERIPGNSAEKFLPKDWKFLANSPKTLVKCISLIKDVTQKCLSGHAKCNLDKPAENISTTIRMFSAQVSKVSTAKNLFSKQKFFLAKVVCPRRMHLWQPRQNHSPDFR